MGVRRLVAALVCVSVLVSCSDDEPKGDPSEPKSSVTTSPTPTVSTSPTGPVVPPEAQGEDEKSAKAFVRFWFEVLSNAMANGDTSHAREFLHADCHACDTLPKRIERIYANGSELRTEGWKVEQMLIDPPARPDRMVFFVRVAASSSEVVDTAGKVIDSTDAQVVGFRIKLSHVDGRWDVLSLELVR